MTRKIEVAIDESGHVHPIDPEQQLPTGRAVLAWPDAESLYPALMSETSLSDWLRREEDEAWAYLQPVE